jgi:hypothetical protein
VGETARDATDNNTAHAHCTLDNKATDTHSEYVILPAFHATNGHVNAPQCNVHMHTAFLVSLPEAVTATDAVTISDGRKITIF